MDQKIREAERRQDIQAWATWTLRLGDTHLIEQLAAIRQQLEWLKRQEAILDAAIPLCSCGGGATHGESCEKHQDALVAYRQAKEAHLANPANKELARAMMLLANDCGHPDRHIEAYASCYFPNCAKPPEWDYDMPMAFCVDHEKLIENITIYPNKKRARLSYDELSAYLLR